MTGEALKPQGDVGTVKWSKPRKRVSTRKIGVEEFKSQSSISGGISVVKKTLKRNREQRTNRIWAVGRGRTFKTSPENSLVLS